jgi:restriction endonuclease
MADAAWAEFEKLAYEIQRDLAGSAQVRLRDTIQGLDSGIPRQIDIAIRQQVGPHAVLIIVDCKDHRAPLDVNVVGEFATVVRDVRANKGALIASRGFTEAAVTLARTLGIDTFNLVDTGHARWRAYVSFPALLRRLYITSATFQFIGVAPGDTVFPAGDPTLWEIYTEDQTGLVLVRDILARKWNAHQLPEVVGRHGVLLADNARLGKADGENRVRVLAEIDIAEAYYFGPWSIQTRGLQNVQTGGLVTSEIRTDALSPYEIEQGRAEGWRQIDNPTTLAVRPVIVLGYSDVIPVSTEPPSDD